MAQHSTAAKPAAGDDFAAWIKLLPTDRGNDFLLRLACNEPGLSHLLTRELRKLSPHETSTTRPEGERVPYARLHAESKAVVARLEREEQERKQAARLQHLQDIHTHRDDYWQQVDQGASTGYDEALHFLSELRDATNQFQTSQEFQESFNTWIRSHLRRPTLLKRLQNHSFTLPEA